MVSKLLFFMQAVRARSVGAKLTKLRLLRRQIFIARVTLRRVNLLNVGFGHRKDLILDIELNLLVSNINLVSLILDLIEKVHGGRLLVIVWKLIVFIYIIIVIIICRVMRGSTQALILSEII